MKRPVSTTMPATPIPPTTGSKGAVDLVMHVPMPVPKIVNRGENPGSQTAPSPQGPIHPGAK